MANHTLNFDHLEIENFLQGADWREGRKKLVRCRRWKFSVEDAYTERELSVVGKF